MKYRTKGINKVHDNLFEIPATGKMQVPGRIYANESMLESILYEDESIQQVVSDQKDYDEEGYRILMKRDI